MNGPLFSNPYVLMRCGSVEEQKALVMRPLRYDDAIVLAKKHVQAAKDANIEDIKLLVRVYGGDFFIVDGEAWPDVCKWVEEVKCEISHAVLHADERGNTPTEDILGKRKRRGPSQAPVHAPSPSVVTRTSTRLPSSSHMSPTSHVSPTPSLSSPQTRTPPAPAPAPSLYPSDTPENSGYITFHMHKLLVKEWLEDHPDHPWLVMPAELHKRVLTYVSRPRHLRDDDLLPANPLQRHWIKRHSKHCRPHVTTRKTYIPGDGAALFAALSRAHDIGGHSEIRYMLNYMHGRYTFGPTPDFIQYWLDACPGC